MKKWWLIASGVLVVLLIAFGWLWLAHPFLPSDIARQVSFAVFYPPNTKLVQVNQSSIKYDPGTKVLTYTATLSPARLIVTNQATPEQFTDVPQTYDKVIENMHPYDTFDTINGKVSLTHPPNINNQQVAVTNTKGTLMFVRADRDLSQDQWRQFFNQLATTK